MSAATPGRLQAAPATVSVPARDLPLRHPHRITRPYTTPEGPTP